MNRIKYVRIMGRVAIEERAVCGCFVIFPFEGVAAFQQKF